MTDQIEFGDPIPHDGSRECPEHARDVPCMVSMGGKFWSGSNSCELGRRWLWGSITHYRLPADHPFYAKDKQPAPAYVAIHDKADGGEAVIGNVCEYEISASGSSVRLNGLDFEMLIALLPGERITFTEDEKNS